MNKPLAILLAVAILLTPASALAHAHLKRSEPAAGAHLAASPSAIRLWFSEQPELSMTFASLRDSAGREIPLSPAAGGEPGQMQIAFRILGTLSSGRYPLSWRTAASDGHPSHGSFGFAVPPTGPAAAITPTQPPLAGRHSPPRP